MLVKLHVQIWGVLSDPSIYYTVQHVYRDPCEHVLTRIYSVAEVYGSASFMSKAVKIVS